MFKQIILILLLSGFALFLSGGIARIEYYIDSDPGYGNATVVSFTGDPDVVANADIPLTGLGGGLHVLYTRAKDSSGKWSHSAAKMFFKSCAANAQLTRLEYFFDTDPGYGNGFALPITPGSDITYVGSISTASVASGVHFLYLRTRDNLGYWSHNLVKMILKSPSTIPALTRLKYYFDGNAGNAQYLTAIPLNGDPAATEMTFEIDPASFGLVTGMHVLNIVAENAAGMQSLVLNKLFFYQSTEVLDLARAEWYFTGSDANPDQMFYLNLPVLETDLTAQFALSLTHLTQGNDYQLHFYMVNTAGQPSLEQIMPFSVDFIPHPVLTINGNSAELNWNEVPGTAYYKVRVRSNLAETGTIYQRITTNFTDSPLHGARFYDITAVSAVRDVKSDLTSLQAMENK